MRISNFFARTFRGANEKDMILTQSGICKETNIKITKTFYNIQTVQNTMEALHKIYLMYLNL